MSKILKFRGSFQRAIGWAAVILAATNALAGEPYLKLVGPPPLRFQVFANNPVFLAELALPKPIVPKPTEVTILTNTPVTQTNITSSSAAESQTIVAGGTPNNSGGMADPASNMLPITPQMINQYFKPDSMGTPSSESNPFQRGQRIMIPAELGFVPPTPGRGHAIYNGR